MKTLKQVKREAKHMFRLCLVDGRLDEGRVRKVAETILQAKRRGHLTLLGQFYRLVKEEFARHTAQVDCAVPLPAELQAGVRIRLERVYGPGVTTVFAQKPALIGGIRIQVGSDVYDGSVRFELDALEKSLGISSANGKKAAI